VGTLSLRRLAARPNARRRSQLLGLPGDVASVLLTYKYYARVPQASHARPAMLLLRAPKLGYDRAFIQRPIVSMPPGLG
jgi:hypothetical protein